MSSQDDDDVRMESLYWLAAGTAHDINNLLMVVVGCAELALNDAALQPQTRQLVRDIVGAGERAGLLTRQLLAADRQPPLPVSVVDAAVVLRDAEALLRRLVGPRVTLHLTASEGPQPVHARASQLEQVVVNLALNARDAMPAGGVVTIALTDLPAAEAEARPSIAGRRVTRISVADQGPGIDPKIQDRIFQPFVTTKMAHGTGLGLAVVRATVAQLGGTIQMTTEQGRGTTFVIDLPRVGEPG